MIVSATGFIPLSPLSIVSTMVIWESSQWLEYNIVRTTGSKKLQESTDRCTGGCDITEVMLKETVQCKISPDLVLTHGVVRVRRSMPFTLDWLYGQVAKHNGTFLRLWESCRHLNFSMIGHNRNKFSSALPPDYINKFMVCRAFSMQVVLGMAQDCPELRSEMISDAKIIWNYMKMNHVCKKSDVILCLCSYDVRVADRAAELWHDGMGKLLVFSGKSGKLTEGLWSKPEAEVFKERAIELGVPETRILTESLSTNTGENVRFCHKLLSERNFLPHSAILVQKPYMERRTYATFLKQWPGNTDHMVISVTSPDIEFLDYPNETVGDLNYTINILVGDFARIKVYEEKGFQTRQDIPDFVQAAFDRLVATGQFSKHLPDY